MAAKKTLRREASQPAPSARRTNRTKAPAAPVEMDAAASAASLARLALQLYIERPRYEPSLVAADAAELATLAAIQKPTKGQAAKLAEIAERYGAERANLAGARFALRFYGHGYRGPDRCDALRIA